MTASMQDNDELMLQAYCDGELDAATMAQFEQRLSADSKLRRRVNDIRTLGRHLRALPVDSLPRDFADRIQSTIGSANPAARYESRRWGWQALAACVCAGIVAGALLMSAVQQVRPHEDVAGLVIANHIRSLLAPQPFDIASSDRHTVKPWFTTRLPESPQVFDLAAAGYPLAGGRVDVIGQQPVATLVYRHGAHFISLTILPKNQTVPTAMVSGYRVVNWRDGGATLVAVSDLPEADIENFGRAFRAEANRP